MEETEYTVPFHTYTKEETRGLPDYVIDIVDQMTVSAGGGFDCQLDVFVRFQAEQFNAGLEAAAKVVCPLCNGANRWVRVTPQPALDGLYHLYDDTKAVAARCTAQSIRFLAK